jgi:ribosome biogenesis GTPase / thiamine phosphate phosphatase
MHHFDFSRLEGIGLTPELADRAHAACLDFNADAPPELLRVTAVHRETLRVHDGNAERPGRVLARLLRDGFDDASALAVGDWVLAVDDGDAWRVHARIAPTSHIARRDGDGSRHPVVSNVDHALVVMGLDDDFNPRRLERYLALVQASDVAPLVVLTKADIAAADPAQRDEPIAALRERIADLPELFVVDATDPATASRFAAVTSFGRTLVVLGSSGAGKSTLTNTLLGAKVQDTGAVRANDGRGMHTTTARTLHRLPSGACIIDTPGLRTLRPDGDERTLLASFGDVAALSARCRFRDCSHGDEPGCAVRTGVALDRLHNFQKMLRETRRDSMTWVERRQQLSAWKSRGKEARVRMKMKREGG